MIEMVFNSPDFKTLQDDAIKLGFADEKGNIIVNGPTADDGSYFLNIVGDVYTPTGETTKDDFGNDVPVMEQQPGVWGRLRVNGGAENIPPFDPAIVKYYWSPDVGPLVPSIDDPETEKPSGGWTTDGVTLAPEWVGNVGVIA